MNRALQCEADTTVRLALQSCRHRQGRRRRPRLPRRRRSRSCHGHPTRQLAHHLRPVERRRLRAEHLTHQLRRASRARAAWLSHAGRVPSAWVCRHSNSCATANDPADGVVAARHPKLCADICQLRLKGAERIHSPNSIAARPADPTSVHNNAIAQKHAAHCPLDVAVRLDIAPLHPAIVNRAGRDDAAPIAP